LLLLTALLATAVVNAQIWKPLDNGLPYTPLAMSSDRHNLYVLYTKDFDGRGGKIYEVSIWNGSYWKTLPSFTTDSAYSEITRIKFFNGFLYMSGRFTEVKGLTNARNILRWNFVSRSYESITPEKQVQGDFLVITDMDVYDNKLFVVGEFSNIQARKVKNIVQFDGKDWLEPNTALSNLNGNGTIYDIEVYKDTLFFGGTFTKIGSKPSNYFAAYANGNWVTYSSNTIKVLKMDNSIDQLYIYGSTTINPANGFFKLRNGIIENTMKGIEEFKSYSDMAVFDGSLWACGSFYLSNDPNNAQSLIQLKNEVWESSSIPSINDPKVLDNFNGKIIVGGKFKYYDKILLNGIAEFDTKSNRISGRVFNDISGDCQYSAPDALMSDRYVVINPGNQVIKLDLHGNYETYVPEGTYYISVQEKKYWKNTACSKPTQIVSVNRGDIADSIDFPLEIERNISDVRINITNYGGWVTKRGKVNLYVITYENIGSNFIEKGTLKMKLDPNIKEIKSSPPYLGKEQNIINWQYENLKSGDLRKILVYATIPQEFPNEKMQFSTFIDGGSSEQSIIDNTDTLNQQVTNTDAPEFSKQVFPAPSFPDSVTYITPDKQYLTYVISFANFGNSLVNNVFVIDTIDLNVDMQYIQEIGSSHPYTTKVISGPPGSNYGVLVWTFMNANLKPNPGRASDFIGDKGFISFKVKLKSSLSDNTVIKNKADVIYDYSDFNTTNTVYSQVDFSLGIGQLADYNNAAMKLFPNPARNLLTIETELQTGFDWIIYDIRGIELMKGLSTNSSYTADLSELSIGMYILKVVDGNQKISTGRFLKAH
jgi:hypothetical protein